MQLTSTSCVCLVQVVKAGELLKEGAIGKPYYAMSNYWEAIGFSTFLDRENFFTNWRFDPVIAGGGILMDGMTHWTRPLTMWYAIGHGIMFKPSNYIFVREPTKENLIYLNLY